MSRLVHASFAAVATMSTVVACEVVLGMDRHGTHAASADASTGPGGRDAGAVEASVPCILPGGGSAQLRLGDVLPSADRFDFCIETTGGGPSPVPGPVLAGAGCPPGLAYKDVLAPVSLPPGTYDVSAVTPGAGCSSPIVTAHAVSLSSDRATAIYLFGTKPGDATLTPFPESRPDAPNADLRFVHALPGGGPLDFGVAAAASTPTTIESPVFTGVTFGETSAPGTSKLGAIDANGYVQFSLVGGQLDLGVAPTGSAAAVLAQGLVVESEGAYTAFAVGKTDDLSFPEELYVCDERSVDGILTRCGGGAPATVTFDVFNAYLFGVFGPFTSLRQPAVVAAPSALSGDVACFTDVYADSDKTAIVNAAPSNGFAYAYTFVGDTMDTPIDDPTTQDGGLPVPPSSPPCTGPLAFDLDALVDCASASCSDTPGAGDSASVTADNPVGCLSDQCTPPVSALVFGSGSAPLCWQCALMEFYGSASFGTTRSECKTLAKPFYAFHGSSSPVLLSRRPLTHVTQWVLPSTDWRVSVIRADVALDNGGTVAAYCTELTSPAAGATRPYTGSWGNGLTDIDAWRAEQTLQIQKLAAYVARTSGAAGQKAVVMGDFYTGPSVPGVLDPDNPDSFAALSAAFPIAAPPGYAPACTQCADNPITTPPGTTPNGSGTWSSMILLSHVPVTDVQAATILLQDPVLTVSIEAGTYAIPRSTYYAYQASVRVRPP